MVSAAGPQFSITQAIDFCNVFRDPQLIGEDGKFRQSQLKKLDQEERRLCGEALEKITTADLSTWKEKKKNLIDTVKLENITQKILDLPKEDVDDSAPWYKIPFIWIAKKAHSFFLWFQNTFMGRITSKQLLDQVSIYCQNASTAKSDVESIEADILPEVQGMIKKRLQERDEFILKGNLANGLLEVYKILLALKSEGKREHIMQKAISYSTIDEVESLKTKPFFVIVRELLTPYFEADQKKDIPEAKFTQLAQSFEAAKKDTSPEKLSVLQNNFSDVMQGVGPLLLFEKSKKATKNLSPLYEASGKAISLTLELENAKLQLETFRQSQKDLSESDDEVDVEQEEAELNSEDQLEVDELTELKANVFQLEEQLKKIDQEIQASFDSTFNEIEKEINEEGEKLFKNKFGTSPELNAETSRLKLDRLSEYGLKSLAFHQGKLQDEAELLKRKYLVFS